jgi:Cof subfamily protein (haloacid dehalogenase superfamily)
MVAMDMDGTLLNDDLKVSDTDKETIYNCLKKGIYIVFLTARSYISANSYAQEMRINIPMVCYNGALIRDSYFGYLYYKNTISLDLARWILNEALKENVYAKVYIEDKFYIKNFNKEAENYSQIFKTKYEICDIEKIDEEPYMIVLKDDELKLKYFTKKIINKSKYKNMFSYTSSKTGNLEITNKNTNKGRALEILSEYLNIKKENILAIGNSLNDISMLNFAGIGVAMKNSDIELKNNWHDISQYSNNESGVSHIIKDFLNL